MAPWFEPRARCLSGDEVESYACKQQRRFVHMEKTGDQSRFFHASMLAMDSYGVRAGIYWLFAGSPWQ